MKKVQRRIIILVAIFILMGGHSVAFANHSRPRAIPGVKVYINGIKFESKETFYDFSNTTLVPMREFFEKLGASLEWDKNAQKIIATTNEKVIELVINSKTAKINGKDKILSVEPKMINNQTYVPLRFIAEALMHEVDWNSRYKIISIIDMKAINERKTSKIYESSKFFKGDYVNMETINNDGIRIKGQTDLEKTGLMFLIDGYNGSGMLNETKEIESNGIYEYLFDLPKKVEEGKYKIGIYLKEDAGMTYQGYCWDIPLTYKNGEMFFHISPMYANNYLESMKNAVIDPKNYLDIKMDNESEKKEIIDLANKIIKETTSNYEKTLKINEWVAQNIYYNWDGYKTGKYGRTDAYGTLQGKKSVCQGYAELTRALLRAVGIPTRLVSGHALGVSAGGRGWDEVDHTNSNHAWNEAFVDGRWIIIDTTWNSSNKYEGGVFKQGGINYKYFDPSLENFSNTHKILTVE